MNKRLDSFYSIQAVTFLAWRDMTRQNTYRPTKFSSTLLLPALWLPTTAICGKSSVRGTPSEANASCSLFTIGINWSIPAFPDILYCTTATEKRPVRLTVLLLECLCHLFHRFFLFLGTDWLLFWYSSIPHSRLWAQT